MYLPIIAPIPFCRDGLAVFISDVKLESISVVHHQNSIIVTYFRWTLLLVPGFLAIFFFPGLIQKELESKKGLGDWGSKMRAQSSEARDTWREWEKILLTKERTWDDWMDSVWLDVLNTTGAIEFWNTQEASVLVTCRSRPEGVVESVVRCQDTSYHLLPK